MTPWLLCEWECLPHFPLEAVIQRAACTSGREGLLLPLSKNHPCQKGALSIRAFMRNCDQVPPFQCHYVHVEAQTAYTCFTCVWNVTENVLQAEMNTLAREILERLKMCIYVPPPPPPPHFWLAHSFLPSFLPSTPLALLPAHFQEVRASLLLASDPGNYTNSHSYLQTILVSGFLVPL